MSEPRSKVRPLEFFSNRFDKHRIVHSTAPGSVCFVVPVAQYGSSWHTSSATVVSTYSAYTRQKTTAEIGGYIGLMHINITYKRESPGVKNISIALSLPRAILVIVVRSGPFDVFLTLKCVIGSHVFAFRFSPREQNREESFCSLQLNTGRSVNCN